MNISGSIRRSLSSKSNAGFTLIETLVYLALFALIMSGLVGSAYVMREAQERNAARAMLEEEMLYLLGKLDGALADAARVEKPGLGGEGAVLTMEMRDGTQRSFDTADGALRQDGVSLSNGDVVVRSLHFVHAYDARAALESVEARFTIITRTPGGLEIDMDASTTEYVQK